MVSTATAVVELVGWWVENFGRASAVQRLERNWRKKRFLPVFVRGELFEERQNLIYER